MGSTYRFDFGPGKAETDYVKITGSTLYDAGRGYGFLGAGRVSAIDRSVLEPGIAGLRRDFCIPLDSSFAVDLPSGTYAVSALIGDACTETHTTIKAGSRIMLRDLRTSAGQFVHHSFSVWVTDGKLVFSFSGLAPRINALDIVSAPQVPILFLAGDSTVTDQPVDGYPYAGWGQALPEITRTFRSGAELGSRSWWRKA